MYISSSSSSDNCNDNDNDNNNDTDNDNDNKCWNDPVIVMDIDYIKAVMDISLLYREGIFNTLFCH